MQGEAHILSQSEAPEYIKNVKKNSIVVIQILMLYLIINNLWLHLRGRGVGRKLSILN